MSQAKTTPFLPLRRRDIQAAFEVMSRKSLQPWMRLNTGLPLQAINSRGLEVNYNGVRFEGSPRDVFWQFFQPSLEDAIAEQFDRTVRHCREVEFFEDSALDETAELLRLHVAAFLGEMTDIDRRLRGNGQPQSVPRRDIAKELSELNELINSHLSAGKLLFKRVRPGWFKQHRWWIMPLLAAFIGLIPSLF